MSQRVIETFDAWAQNGRAEGMEKEHGDVVHQVVERMSVGPGERILDLGCGNGWATRLLAQTNAGVQAIGIDASPQMIARADELHSFTIRARYDLGSFEELEFGEDAFDRVFSMEAIYYSANLEQALSECARVLKPGGHADVIVDFYKENTATECWARVMDLPLHFLAETEWRDAFANAGFRDPATTRVVDTRGPGNEADFTPDECYPDWQTRVATYEAGSLWIHATR